MKLTFAQIESFLQKIPASCRIFLFYGPDEGMNRMRSQNIIRQRLGEKPDPFALVEFQGGELSDNPNRLIDEAQTMAFGAPHKILYVRQAGDGLTLAVNSLLQDCPDFCTVILESAELAPKSSLRQICESADRTGVAIPAYEDEGRGLQQFIQNFFTQSGMTLESGAMPALLGLLSGNRMINQQELQKLALYVSPQKRITVDDIEACLISQANLGLEDVIYAAFSGQGADVIDGLDKLRGEGMFGIPILRAASRHAMRLHFVQSMTQGGSSEEDAIKMLRPAIFFKKQKQFEAQLRQWNMGTLAKLLQKLLDAEIAGKSTGYPLDELTGQTLMGICLQAQIRRKNAA